MMSHLNWVDYVILAIFAFSALLGLYRGFVKEVIALITLIAAVVIAVLFAHPLAAKFTNSPTVQNVVNQASTSNVDAAQPASYIAVGISFTVLFLVTMLVGMILGSLLSMAFQGGVLGFGNRLLGAIFGLVRGFIINLVIIFLLQLSPFASETWWQESKMVAAFQPAIKWLDALVSPSLAHIKEKFGETMQGVGSSIQGVSDSVTEKVKGVSDSVSEKVKDVSDSVSGHGE